MNNNYQSKLKIFGSKTNSYVMGGFLFGLVFIIIAWGLEFLFGGVPFSIKGNHLVILIFLTI